MDRKNISAKEFIDTVRARESAESESFYSDYITSEYEITEKIEFQNEVFNNNTILSDSSFSAFNIFSSEFKVLVIQNCTFEADFQIFSGNFKSVFFINCTFNSSFIIHGGKFDYITFERSTVHKQMSIYGGLFKDFNFTPFNDVTKLNIGSRLVLIDRLRCYSKNGLYIYVKNCIINTLICEGFYNSSSRVYMIDIVNNRSSFSEVFNDGKIIIVNSKVDYKKRIRDKSINHLDFYESLYPEEIKSILHSMKYSEHGNVQTIFDLLNNHFISIKDWNLREKLSQELVVKDDILAISKPKFEILNSSLGHFELNDIDLKQYELEVFSTDLSLIKLVNSKFPTNRIKSKTLLDKYSVYNDLYTSANKQNNVKDKIEYYKASQKYLLRHFFSFEKFKVYVYFPIFTSLIYSNHGSSWARAGLITIIFGAISFGILLLTFEGISLDISEQGLNTYIYNYLQYFPEFINPLHKLDFLESRIGAAGKLTSLIDLFGRLIIGVGIFETVRSFRKFVRQ